jgi:hypothetical protein
VSRIGVVRDDPSAAGFDLIAMAAIVRHTAEE